MRLVVAGATCLVLSFFIGIQTAGDVQPISLIEAGGTQIEGDMNGSGDLDINDVVVILEVVRGYREMTPELLNADPNDDGQLTIDDALRILSTLSLR